jgi:aldose 1-epimerase
MKTDVLKTNLMRAGTLVLAFILCVAAAASPTFSRIKQKSKAGIEMRPFGQLSDGSTVNIYTLTNRNGLRAQITNYGGAVVSLTVPDAHGQMADIVLGYDEPRGYETDTFYIGAIIGRYANRIAGGQFSLGGVKYNVARNNSPNHLHGGVRGFNKVMWRARELRRKDGVALELSYLSRDGEEGYPGNLSATVTYVLTNANELRIEYRATTDKQTIVNLTNHSYFNLTGAGAGSSLGQILRLNADKFTPVNETAIPTGELMTVSGTPFDFTRGRAIGSRIEQPDDQLRLGKGYDHNFVLNKHGNELSLAADVYDPVSGRGMQVWTTEPGLQLYTANYLEKAVGKAGKIYHPREAFCLEAEHFPDSPNRPSFPSVTLKPGGLYSQTTIYKFTVRGTKKS